jgi:hypothetical protein
VYLSADCPEDKVEQDVTRCQGAMSSVVNATAKKIRIGAKSNRWWNADINEWRNAVRREKRRSWKRDDAARAKAELQKLSRKSLRQMLSNFMQNLHQEQ